MKKLLLSAVAALALCGAASAQGALVGPPNQLMCNQFVQVTGTGAEVTFIPGVAGKITVLCGWHFTSTAAGSTTFQLFFGSAANCGGGTSITPPMNVTSTAPSVDHTDFAVLSYAALNNICVTAPTTMTGGLWYAQF
jgi:hypothetical protein